MTPIEWLEQHYDMLDDLEHRYDVIPGVSVVAPGPGVAFRSGGPMISFKDDDTEYELLYYRAVTPVPEGGLNIDPATAPHP